MGTVETKIVLCKFDDDPTDGEVEWEGETSDFDGETQEAVVDGKGRYQVQCTNGHEWFTEISGMTG